nr:hypothetical protein Iba_chr11cCG1310 [Ipomoea batatas]GMD54772.1 hypothetical protein Iba_chr11dCG1570 [Ipomoea batatas]GMD56215.1 hypothetical protein Iba_chr11eCG1060 [Ipomoea batatas]GMD58100.1 hypothetical protein Iba_chr11fCG2330 [Ipomoea batatas]
MQYSAHASYLSCNNLEKMVIVATYDNICFIPLNVERELLVTNWKNG